MGAYLRRIPSRRRRAVNRDALLPIGLKNLVIESPVHRAMLSPPWLRSGASPDTAITGVSLGAESGHPIAPRRENERIDRGILVNPSATGFNRIAVMAAADKRYKAMGLL
jgi:hypothetical protein